MAEIKTKATKESVKKFIDSFVEDEQKKKDSYELIKIMKKVTKEDPVMWGPSIIGFGKYAYKYESGHSGEMCVTGFSPRKAAISIYLLSGIDKAKEIMKDLGKFKMAKACLYVKRLSDIDIKVLEKLIRLNVNYIKSFKEYPHRA